MKTKIRHIVVQGCSSCVHRHVGEGFGFPQYQTTCGLNQRHLTRELTGWPDKIPDWCPLEEIETEVPNFIEVRVGGLFFLEPRQEKARGEG